MRSTCLIGVVFFGVFVSVVFNTSASSIFKTGQLPLEPESMIALDGGCYVIGSPNTQMYRDADEGQQELCVGQFLISSKEVTVAEYRQFIKTTGYTVDDNSACWASELNGDERAWDWRDWASWERIDKAQALKDNAPAACISYNDAVAYITWLNKVTKKTYRLPTEAEWEFAARGQNSDFAPINATEQICQYANVADKSHAASSNFICDDGFEMSSEVASFKPNSYGLYDMLGNVWEWSCSKHDPSYDGAEIRCFTNDIVANRASRGASWDDNPESARITNRSAIPPHIRISLQGFRLAMGEVSGS